MIIVDKTEAELAQQRKDELEKSVQSYMDKEARLLGYDNVLSACSYASHINPFQAEGQSFVAWRGAVWEYCYQALADVESGTRTIPTTAELIAELPARVQAL